MKVRKNKGLAKMKSLLPWGERKLSTQHFILVTLTHIPPSLTNTNTESMQKDEHSLLISAYCKKYK